MLAERSKGTGGGGVREDAVDGIKYPSSPWWDHALTFGAIGLTLVSVAASIQQTEMVDRLPPIIPAAIAGLVAGYMAAHIRARGRVVHSVGFAYGLVVSLLMAAAYAEGTGLAERLVDVRFRMGAWSQVVTAGDISNDILPFVLLVHAIAFLFCYWAAWSIVRWSAAGIAVLVAGALLTINVSFLEGQPRGAVIAFLFGAALLVSHLALRRARRRWDSSGTLYAVGTGFSSLAFTACITCALVWAAFALPLGNETVGAEQLVEKTVEQFDVPVEHLARIFHNTDVELESSFLFPDVLPIGGRGSASAEELFEVTPADLGRLRVASYDEYTGGGWSSSTRTRIEVEGATDAPPSPSRYSERADVTVEITLKQRERMLPVPGTPLGTSLRRYTAAVEGEPPEIVTLTSERQLSPGDNFEVTGSLSTATSAELRGAGTDYPAWLADRYLQLPANLPEQVEYLARIVAGDSGSPYDQALSLQAFLRQAPAPPAALTTPPGRDAVEYFLFDSRSGTSIHRASALAVMLRVLGVPARLSTGYAWDTEDVESNSYVIGGEDIAAWVEVFFPGYGWVVFRTGVESGGGASAGHSPANLPAASGAAPFPTSTVPRGEETPQASPPDASRAAEAEGRDRSFLASLMFAASGALALVGLLLGLRTGWNWGLDGLDKRAAMWAKTQRLAGAAGFGVATQETPLQWARKVGHHTGLEEQAERLSWAYTEARYGPPGRRTNADLRGTVPAYRRLRLALVKIILGLSGRPRDP